MISCIMPEEKDRPLGLEPVLKFLPSARFKSVNNLVHGHRIKTRLMIPGIVIHTICSVRGGGIMHKYFLGIDVSKGYADFIILDWDKQVKEENFQLDDTFNGHFLLHDKLDIFLHSHPESCIFAGVESTGGYEDNWFNSLLKFQGSLNIQTTRLNPLHSTPTAKPI